MPTLSRTIRLFVSSTFSDMKSERDVLQREVFPKLRQLCLSNGLRFQAIDLRWGVPEEAGKDNRTMRICLRELKRCQEGRPKPNFLILLGDRYGWRPLPEIIPADLFAQLRDRLPAAMQELLEWRDAQPADAKGWYRRDDNAVPPAYELRPRGDDERWHETVAEPLLRALEEAARQIGLDPETHGVAIGTSATEQEIVEGALKVEDAREHVHAFFRSISVLPQNPWPRDFVDVSEDGARDAAATARLDDLKARIEAKIGATNVHRYTVPWHDGGVQPPDFAQFGEDVYAALKDVILQQIAELTATSPEAQEEEAHRAFGDERCRGFIGRTEPLEHIAACLRGSHRGMLAVVGPSGSGKSALMAEAVRRAREIHGEGAVLARFIGATPDSANILSLLRNLVAEIRRRYPAPVRSSGLSRSGSEPGANAESEPPEGGTPNEKTDGDIPVEINPLTAAFHEALARPTAERPLFIFLDALDQLAPGNGALEGHWLPGSLAPHVRLILSAALPAATDAIPDDVTVDSFRDSPSRRRQMRAAPQGERKSADHSESSDSQTVRAEALEARSSHLSTADPRAVVMATLERRAAEIQQIPLWPLSAADGRTLLAQWLADAGRTVQPAQEEAILESFAQEGSPLWLRVAIGESQRLASWDAAPHFNPGLPGLMQQVLGHLSTEDEHGAVLVKRALGSIASARHGLAEDEVMDVLSADKEVMTDFRRRSPKSPQNDALPVAAWARLHGDIAPYLTEHQLQNAALLSFYHRSLLEAVQAAFLDTGEKQRAAHQRLTDYFGSCTWFIAPVEEEKGTARRSALITDPPDARKASELPWQLLRVADASDPDRERPAEWDPPVAVLCDMEFLEAKCRAGLVFELQEDYRDGRTAIPEAQMIFQEEQRRTVDIARWTNEIILYSHAWSERWERIARGEPVDQSEPVVPTAPATCRVWSDEEIEAECRRIREEPTRLDRLAAFAGFVQGECYPLFQFGGRDGFVLQHALNYAPGGPVHDAAARLLPQCGTPLLLRRWPEGAAWNPKPALLRTLEGQSSTVESVSVTLDGRRAVSGGRDETLRVWDLESGACLRTLERQGSSVESVSVTPGGRRAVSGDGYTLRVWDLESGACLRILEGHSEWVKSLSVTLDGRRAVSGDGHTLRVWDLESGACLRTLEGHRGSVKSVSVTPDGRRAVSGSWDDTLRVWDLESGACLRTLEGHSGCVESVSVTPDGRCAVSGSWDYTLRVWDLESGACLRILEGHSDSVRSVAVTADGRRAVSGSWDGTLRVWDLESGACLRILEGHSKWVKSLSVTLDGRRVVSGSDDKTLRVWELEKAICLRTLEGHRGNVESVSVTPDGRRVVSGSSDDTLRVWDLESGACLRILEGHIYWVVSVSVTPDGRRAVSGSEDGTLRVWDLESGACLRTLEGHGAWVGTVSVTPDGRRAVSGGEDGTLQVWDLESGACLRTLEGHSHWVVSVSVTPDGRRAVSGSWDNTLRVWDLESGHCLRMLEGHRNVVQSVSVMPDGRRAVSGSEDGTLRVWDLETGACLRTLEGHSDSVRSVAVTADGRRVVSRSEDKTLRVWNLESSACEGVFVAPAPVSAAAVLSGTVAIGTTTGQVLLVQMRDLPCGPAIAIVPHTSDTAHEASLRRGLDSSRRRKGPNDEETLAHLVALAFHLERMGKTDEARSLREESAAQAVQPQGGGVLRPHPGAQSPPQSTDWLAQNARPLVVNILFAALTAGAVIVSLRWPWGWLIGVPVALVELVFMLLTILGLAGVSPAPIALCPKCGGKSVWWRKREIICQKCGTFDWPQT